MNATQATAIRNRLLSERERIVSEWQSHGGHTGPCDEWDLRDLEERAVLSTSDVVERRIADDHLNLLRKVQFALKRLEEGTYETCEVCGAGIPLDRLMAKPSVSLCINCQEAKDALKS
jgi:DnaK suppressor protein